MEITAAKISKSDVRYWAEEHYKIKLQAGTFSFKGREYQIEPMGCKARRKCVMKATQGGFTETEVLDSLHGMIYKLLPKGVLYLFPTTDDVGEFSKSRFNPLITANRQAIGRFVKNVGGKSTDTTSLKKIHESFLYLRGARLSQKISDLNESSKLKSIPVDRVVFDETDHMSEEVFTKAISRMGDSTIKQERYLSNPLVPGEGIDKIFQLSDQRYYFRKCHSCGESTCAELFFMESPERCVGVRADGAGYIACKKCGREVHIADGQWQPQVKANTGYMHGYQWSQLTSSTNDPKEILDQFLDPPHGNLSDIYRLRLGLPYIAAEDRLTKADVYGCCSNMGMSPSHPGPCAMGVDVGKTKHIIIGTKIGNDQYKIVKVVILSSWDDIHDIARKYNVKSAVIDIRPYQDAAMEFQKAARYPVFLCEYSDNPAYTRTWDTKREIVKDYRTALFDASHRLTTTPGSLTIPRTCPDIDEFVKQMCVPYKLLETNKRTGAKQYRYKGTNDHYRNALNYFMLAASTGRIATARRGGKRQSHAKNDYAKY